MESVSRKVLEQAIELLGKPELTQHDVEARLRASGVKEIVAQRLASFIPEAFGMVAAAEMKRKPAFQATFRACDEKGKPEDIPFSSEPIFGLAMSRAKAMYKEGSREVFDAVAKRSSVMEVITDANEKKSFYEGAVIAIETGVPAEAYREEKVEKAEVPIWKRVLRELGTVEVEYAEVVFWWPSRRTI